MKIKLCLCAFIMLFSSVGCSEKQIATFSEKELHVLEEQLKESEDFSFFDKGDYYLAQKSDGQVFYVFTNKLHPGYPGYIKWTVSIENEEVILKAESNHDGNEKAFHEFETTMNDLMLKLLKQEI